jgi:hypothetical protein
MIRFLLGIPSRLKLWLALAVGAIGVVLGIYAKGRSDESADNEADDAARKIKTLETAREVKADVDQKPDADVRRDLSRWVRRDE